MRRDEIHPRWLDQLFWQDVARQAAKELAAAALATEKRKARQAAKKNGATT